MAVLIFALVLVLIVGLCVYAIDLLPLDSRFKIAAKLLVIIVAILLLIDRSGLA
jgi:hypothetical protein